VTLATTGTHTVLADPLEDNTGTYTLTLYDVPADSTGTMTINAAPITLSLTPGQKGTRTFSGTSGQLVTVHVTNSTIGGMPEVRLLKPDGTQMTSGSSFWANFDLPQQTLPVTGTYTIAVDPSGSNNGSMNIAVTEP